MSDEHSTKAPQAPRTAGAVRLTELVRARGRSTVARALDVSEGALRHWEAGRRVPGDEQRARIEAELGIARATWVAPAPPTAAYEAVREPEPASPATGASEADIDARIRALLAQSERDDWAPRDKLGAVREATSLARHRARLRGEYAPSEAAIAKSPQWARLRDALVDALAQHPNALADVVAALERSGVAAS